MTPLPLRLRTPAKINLTLAVLGRRPDGFHEIESWVLPIGWFDELVLAPAAGFDLRLHDTTGQLAADSSNLVARAAQALAQSAGRSPDVRIDLHKHIPIAAGLGGGSSDAAATLKGLNELWRLDWPIQRLAAIAKTLGSDAPFFLQPRSAILRGRGERIESATKHWNGWVVLVTPCFGLATIEVYRRYTRAIPSDTAPLKPWLSPFRNSFELSRLLFNDLEPAAFDCEPRLGQFHAALNGLDGRPVRMTGSGSTLFALFDSRAEADHWAQLAQSSLKTGGTVHVVQAL